MEKGPRSSRFVGSFSPPKASAEWAVAAVARGPAQTMNHTSSASTSGSMASSSANSDAYTIFKKPSPASASGGHGRRTGNVIPIGRSRNSMALAPAEMEIAKLRGELFKLGTTGFVRIRSYDSSCQRSMSHSASSRSIVCIRFQCVQYNVVQSI